MSQMTQIDAQARIKEITFTYFVDLINELSKPSVFQESLGCELSLLIETIAVIDLPEAIYRKYITKKDQQAEIPQGMQEKYQLLKSISNQIILENLLNPEFFLPKNTSKEKRLLDQVCQVHIKITQNHNLEQLLQELRSAAVLIEIITKSSNPSTLTLYKDALRACHIETGQSPVRDQFSKKVLSILYPFFLPESKTISYGRFLKNTEHQPNPLKTKPRFKFEQDSQQLSI